MPFDPRLTNNIGILTKTSDGSLTLAHHEHGETYHSDLGAKTEAEQLYLGRSGILESFSSGKSVHVLDVGLGLGYNAIATVAAWLKEPNAAGLSMLSLEINLDLIQLLASSKAEWQVDWPDEWLAICLSIQSNEVWKWSAKIQHPISGSEFNWQIVGGDALGLSWKSNCEFGPFDFIWQDAFSPKTCPQLWTDTWFAQLRSVASANCVMVTYSVARMVRDQMIAAGWAVERIPGSGKKKHWLRALNTSEISGASD